jgi:hypothetical protein
MNNQLPFDRQATKTALDTTLATIGYDITDPNTKVWIRCLAAKAMPIEIQKQFGMTYELNGTTQSRIFNGWYYPESNKFVLLKKLYVDGQPVKNDNGSPKWVEKAVHLDGLAFLHSINHLWGIYFIPNVTEGSTDADIIKFKTLFWETDLATKEEQLQQIAQIESELGQKISLSIETKNSYHNYCLLTEEILDSDIWVKSQQRVIQKLNSDESITSLAQAMRLPGFYHCKWNAEKGLMDYFPCTIAQISDSVFSLDEFDKILPPWDASRWEKKAKAKRQFKDKLSSGEAIDSSPIGNPWDIRNFSQYLEGAETDPEGWMSAKCPAHNGVGNRSFKLNLENGRFKCWAGCCPKDIYKESLQLAINKGYKLPVENDLTVCKREAPSAIALAKGSGFHKPSFISEKFNSYVIVEPKGSFPDNAQRLYAELQNAYELVGQKHAILYPSPGDVCYQSSIDNWKATCELLTSLGWSYKFAWWGQAEESQKDIVNLPVNTKIDYISPNEFFGIAEIKGQLKKQKRTKEQKQKEDEERFQLVRAAKKLMTDITETPYKTFCVSHMKEVVHLIEPGVVNIVISDTGTGKTEAAGILTKKSDGFYSIYSRRSLAKASSVDLGGIYKEDTENASECEKICFCNPSIPQFDPRKLNGSNKMLLLDEFPEMSEFNFSDLCDKQGSRPLVLSSYETFVKTIISAKGTLLAMSADTTQKDIDYLKKLLPPGTEIRLIINTFRHEKPTIKVHDKTNPNGLVAHLIENLKHSVPCFVLDDVKDGCRGCKSIAEFIRRECPELTDKILEINSDTQNDEKVIQFFQNVNEESKKYLLIVCSPSVTSGINITNGVFNNGVYAFCNGILIDREIKQFLCRIRGAKQIFIWIAESGFIPKGLTKDDYTAEAVKEHYQRNYKENSKIILSCKAEYQPLKDEWESPHFTLFCQNQAYRVGCLQFLKKFTIEHLQECGYTIEIINFGEADDIEDKLKSAWGEIELNEAIAISEARFLTEQEKEDVEESFRKGIQVCDEIKRAYRKTDLRDKFGEELIEKIKIEKHEQELQGYAAAAIKNRKNKYYYQLEHFWLLSQDITESVERDYSNESRQMKTGKRFAGDITNYSSKKKAREKLDLKKYLDPNKWWEPRDYKPIIELLRKHPQRTKDVIGFSVENITDGQIFGQLFEQIGLRLDKQEVEGQKWKRRKINKDDWEVAQLYVKYKLELKEEKELERIEREQQELQNLANLATRIANTHTREEYELVKGFVTLEQLEAALKLIPVSVRERINSWYKITQVLATQGALPGLGIESAEIATTEISQEVTANTKVVEIVETKLIETSTTKASNTISLDALAKKIIEKDTWVSHEKLWRLGKQFGASTVIRAFEGYLAVCSQVSADIKKQQMDWVSDCVSNSHIDSVEKLLNELDLSRNLEESTDLVYRHYSLIESHVSASENEVNFSETIETCQWLTLRVRKQLEEIFKSMQATVLASCDIDF